MNYGFIWMMTVTICVTLYKILKLFVESKEVYNDDFE